MGFYSWLTDSWAIDWTLTAGSVGLVTILSALYAFQTKLIYLPQFPPGARTEVWRPSQFAFHPKHDEEVFLRTRDGLTLHGFWLSDDRADPKDLPTFIYFQGNAGNIGHRLGILRKLHETIPCNTFIISYRGFGRSDGSPDEAGLRIDAQAALDYVLSRPDVNPDKIILYGQSIGGAVAFDLASRNQSKIHALLLENTFLSLHKLIPHLLPWIGWARGLCHQKWDSETRLAEMIDAATAESDAVSLPHMLFLAGAKDILVPPFHMKRLHEMASKVGKSTIIYSSCPTGDHVNTCVQSEYFPAIKAFMDKIQ